MEIIEEDDEEIKQLMLRISRKEITLCDSCDAFFDYIPQKEFCDECMKKKQRERKQSPEYKAKEREYAQRPEVKAKKREYARERYQRPENKAKAREYQREYQQRPEVKARKRERYQRNKKLREEEWFLLDE